MTTLEGLRANALSPSLYADRVPDGVLKDVGLSAWEMPPTATGGGYLNAIRPFNHLSHDQLLLPPLRSNPQVFTRKDMEELDNVVHGTVYGTMSLADLPTVYGVGTSLTLQNCVFAPRAPGSSPEWYDYRPDIDAILAQWTGGRRLYVHLGSANNEGFPTGGVRFNLTNGLRCRAVDNLSRPYVDAAGFGIETTRYLHQRSLFRVDFSSGAFVSGVYDTTAPAVVALIEGSIAELVGHYGAQLRYILHGESGNSLFYPVPSIDRSRCGSHPLDDQCAQCAPTTNYSALNTVGFRAYLRDVLGLNEATLSARWSIAVDDIDDINPEVSSLCEYGPEALADWNAFQSFLMHELRLREYRAAKTSSPTAHASVMTFTEQGAELSALVSDFPSFGDWVGHTADEYRSRADYPLESAASSTWLGGVPACFAISAPPFVLASPPIGANDVPPIMRAGRTYHPANVRAFFRDALTSSAAHIGYLKCPSVGFGADPSSVTAVLDGIAEVVSMHPTRLALSGAWSRVVIQCADFEHLTRPAFEDGAARVTYHLRKRLRALGVPVALFSSDRVTERPHASWRANTSLVIVPHPLDLEATRANYTERMPDGATGAALLLAEEPADGNHPAWVDTATSLAGLPTGTLYRCLDDLSAPVNIFLFATRPRQACEPDDYFAAQAQSLIRQVIPIVEASISDIEDQPYVNRPVIVTHSNGLPAPVTVSTISDGLNFTVAIGNQTDEEIELSASVDQRVATALDMTYAPHAQFKVSPGDTVYRHFEGVGTIDDLDIAEALNSATENLDALELIGSYDVTAGRAVIAAGAALLADGHSGRALAAYIAAVRMVYIETSYASGPDELTVRAQRIGLLGEGPTSPLVGGQVSTLWPLNGREHGVSGWTTGSGVVILTLGTPTEQRWDFATSSLVAPGPAARTLVEVHVTAQDTGASARRQVALV